MNVSVIVPFFEITAIQLKNVICNVLEQSLQEVELVLVCDNTLQNLEHDCAKVIKKMCKRHKNIEFVNLKANYGTLEARRIGLECAKGDYIFFLDSDDALASKDALKKLYEMAFLHKADIVEGKQVLSGNWEEWPEKNRENAQRCFKNYGNYNLYAQDEKLGLLPQVVKTSFTSLFLTGKLFKKYIILNAYNEIPNTYCVILDDLVICHICFSFAKSYITISDDIYLYNIGSGISTSIENMSLEKWSCLCTSSAAFTILLWWAQEKQVDAFIKREFEKKALNSLHELKKLLQTVKEEDKSEAEKILEQAWGKELTEQA
ncbi:MAG: glycosyltransferase family 2 protein [Treponema sp.]|nr:glycosyltransferase family 2 protein [Treponema sp.]